MQRARSRGSGRRDDLSAGPVVLDRPACLDDPIERKDLADRRVEWPGFDRVISLFWYG
jgi:hypothetical protein